MTFESYSYRESERSIDEDDHHIDRVEVEEEDESVKPVNQNMTSFASKLEVVSVNDQYRYNDYANNYRHSSLSVDELEVEKN
jgi:DNA polymerase/3'-5' exonuclease PolX